MIGNKKDIQEYLDKQNLDTLFEITKKQEKSLRSIAQNKYYFWVIVKMIWDYHWYTPVETHELLKLTVWLDTTTWLSTDEFSFLCNMIRDLWKEKFDFYIPAPNELEELRSIEKYLFY